MSDLKDPPDPGYWRKPVLDQAPSTVDHEGEAHGNPMEDELAVRPVEKLDLSAYVNALDDVLNGEVAAEEFEDLFLSIRRVDERQFADRIREAFEPIWDALGLAGSQDRVRALLDAAQASRAALRRLGY